MKNDSNFVGYKILFEDFYEELRLVFEETLADKSEDGVEDFLRRVSNYVMRRLHNTFFTACKEVLS